MAEKQAAEIHAKPAGKGTSATSTAVLTDNALSREQMHVLWPWIDEVRKAFNIESWDVRQDSLVSKFNPTKDQLREAAANIGFQIELTDKVIAVAVKLRHNITHRALPA